MISFIFAMDRNNLIGKDNDLPWHLPEDLKHFKKITNGKTIVMGRKTFQSLPGILSNRYHVVLTRSDMQIRSPFVRCFNSVEEILDKYKEEELFVIGGAEIFNLFMPYVDKMFVTYIDNEFEGDVHFPSINDNEWELLSSEKGLKDEKNPYEYYFRIYNRRN